MAYQIPQQLEYKEKIMFGLTFRQLVYAFIFGLIALMFFKRIDNETLRFTMASIPIILGFGFIFFNLEQRIRDYYVFLKRRKVDGESLKKFLGIDKIEDNYIINSKGKKIAVLKVSTINFSIKPTKEKEAIIKSFQKFLNSLDFQTQIIVNTESIKLEDYLRSLRSRIKNKSFEGLFTDYQKNLKEIIKTESIMNRSFYIIIPEETDIKIQIRICLERLGSLRLKSRQLKTNELKHFLRICFNSNRKDIFPEQINNFQDHLEINKKFYRTISASGYPRYVEEGFLDKIISSLGDFDLSIHIKPYPIDTMLIGLNRELQKQRADLFSMKTKGVINPSLEIQYRDTRGTLEDLQKGKERLFNVALYVNCKADSLKELELLTKKVESELNSLMIQPQIPSFRMLNGFKSTSPLGLDALNFNRNITTDALSAFFPFTSQFLEMLKNGKLGK